MTGAEAGRHLYRGIMKPLPGTPTLVDGADHEVEPAIEGLTFTQAQIDHFQDFADERFATDWPPGPRPGRPWTSQSAGRSAPASRWARWSPTRPPT